MTKRWAQHGKKNETLLSEAKWQDENIKKSLLSTKIYQKHKQTKKLDESSKKKKKTKIVKRNFFCFLIILTINLQSEANKMKKTWWNWIIMVKSKSI